MDNQNDEKCDCKEVRCCISETYESLKEKTLVEVVHFKDATEKTFRNLFDFAGDNIIADFPKPQEKKGDSRELSSSNQCSVIVRNKDCDNVRALVGSYIVCIKINESKFYEVYKNIDELLKVYKKVENINYNKLLVNSLTTSEYTQIKYVNGKNSDTPTIFSIEDAHSGLQLTKIVFQDGPIKENGVNGVHNEDLIACVLERLFAFQKSGFSCRENAIVITKLEEALMWLRKRTNDRKSRGVEGLNLK